MHRKVSMQKYSYLREFCKLQNAPAIYRTAFTRQGSLVRSQHRPLTRYFVLQVKHGRREKVLDILRSLCAATVQQRGGQPAQVVLSGFHDPYQVTLLDYGVALEETNWYP